jgi:iron complex transport system substrate-binding protein
MQGKSLLPLRGIAALGGQIGLRARGEQRPGKGQDIRAASALQRLKGFTQRPGWADLPAVKNQRVYAVYHGATRSVMDAALLQYVAKTLYPDLFRDLNPLATYLGFYQRYLPIRPHGTFMLGLNGSDKL